jgi:hypothetical protein
MSTFVGGNPTRKWTVAKWGGEESQMWLYSRDEWGVAQADCGSTWSTFVGLVGIYNLAVHDNQTQLAASESLRQPSFISQRCTKHSPHHVSTKPECADH